MAKVIDNNKTIDRVYRKYIKSVNMTYTELLLWSRTKLSKLASLTRNPIKRNLRLLSKNRNDWDMRDIKQANRTISYLARAKKIPKSDKKFNGYTRNEIALKNWGYDVKK